MGAAAEPLGRSFDRLCFWVFPFCLVVVFKVLERPPKNKGIVRLFAEFFFGDIVHLLEFFGVGQTAFVEVPQESVESSQITHFPIVGILLFLRRQIA